MTRKKKQENELPSLPSVEDIEPRQEVFLGVNETIESMQGSDMSDKTEENVPIVDEMPTIMQTLEIPMAKLRHGYEPRRCDVSSLTGLQRETLRRVTNGLIAKDASLANGRKVTKPQDAIKWMLESLPSE